MSKMHQEDRAGTFQLQPSGISTFLPRPLPPNPPLEFGMPMLQILSSASLALGRLDSATRLLPSLDLFLTTFIRKEALLSSQIEGTQASLVEVLEVEAHGRSRGAATDAGDVLNYIKALRHGMDLVGQLPTSLRLIREVHAVLMEGTRGGEKTPGEFRRSQNWIGPAGSTPSTATYLPPSVEDMKQALYAWETYLHEEDGLPPVVRIALLHAQFETIHPFLDGNGRLGRLLISFLLTQYDVLKEPVLFISNYFKVHQNEYYMALQRVRTHGDWESWVTFFLTGVMETAMQAAELMESIAKLRESLRAQVQAGRAGRGTTLVLLDHLFQQPYTTLTQVTSRTRLSMQQARQAMDALISMGIASEITGMKRNRVFSFGPYFDVLGLV